MAQAIWTIEVDDESSRRIVETWQGPWGKGPVDWREAYRRFDVWCVAPYEMVTLRRNGRTEQFWRKGSETYSQSISK